MSEERVAARLAPLLACLLALAAQCGAGVPDPAGDFLRPASLITDLLRGRALARRPGPCRASGIVIYAYAEADILKRASYPASTTVTIQVQRSITLTAGLTLFGNFSCTVIRNRPGTAPTLLYPRSDIPLLTLYSASNVLITGISLKGGVNRYSKPCAYGTVNKYWRDTLWHAGVESGGLKCPALYVSHCFGIQFTRASVLGRIDVFRSLAVTIDSVKATMVPFSYSTTALYYGASTHGVIRMGETSTGPGLLGSGNVISNCEVYGAWELITLYRGAAGVTVRNNYLHDFNFAAIRCGADSTFVFDCHLNTITNNYIINPLSYLSNPKIIDNNNAGIYFCTHWFNPGNVARCNYVHQTDFCFYFDNASSGIVVDGGVCVNMNATGVKVNNGKFNRVRSLVVAKTLSKGYMSYVSCLWMKVFNCLQYDGRNWDAVRKAYYNTPRINRLWPWMAPICNPTIPRAKYGLNCNPAGSLSGTATGYCSGLPYGNDVETFGYYPPPSTSQGLTAALGCDQVPVVPKLNIQRWFNVTGANFAAGFINAAANDFGLRPGSPIFRIRPGFRSCPRSAIGIKYSNPYFYYANYNIPQPWFFNAVVNFNFSHIFDNTIVPK